MRFLKFKHTIYLLLLIFISSCTAYKEVDIIRVGDYGVGDISSKEVELTVNMEVNNPNGYNIRIKKSTLDLLIEGKKIGETKMVEDIVLKKRTQDTYQFRVKANYKELSKAVFSSIGSLFGKKEITIGLQGKVKAKAFGIIGKRFKVDVTEQVNIQELMKLSGLK